ncbi:MAG: putative chemotaxis protein-glutamate methylesterase [Thermonema sp.]|jgi:two-component system chemotaxis response regulator CheB|uniref:chemotaxis protein CheB n=1 Tax=Thermonema TaxID=28194 RepID=UPI0005711CB3|nr:MULTISPECIES: chemotaxis protein CheB [Thermonema]GIV39130.1 MAG: putative chemotaxis protein-glutamate methylesterase [Thermonema sp.]
MARFDHISSKYKLIVIGGSAGSFQVVSRILQALPEDFPLPIAMCLHRLKDVREGFAEALSLKTNKPVVEPLDKELIKKGTIYLAPANYHLCVELGQTFSLSTEEPVNNSRPSIDLLFETAAYAYRDKLIGILLSGANRDGAWGMKKIHERGGLTIVQEPSECLIDTMPASAMQATRIDYVLRSDQIIDFLRKLHKQYA